MIAAVVIFWLCVWAIAHTYVIYPVLLHILRKIKGRKSFRSFEAGDELPMVTILMAAYNEESVIEDKIRSVFNTSYPMQKVEMLVGSDNSNDNTNTIVLSLCEEFPNLHFFNFEVRQGKIGIINQLSDKSLGSILVVTDANVMFSVETLPQLIKYFADEGVGLVDTRMNNYGLKKDGISVQEKSYISREVYIKHLESSTFGTMIGPFGGCYAVRKSLFVKVPSNYLVDDFFVCMSVFDQGKLAINNLDAPVYEDVSNNLSIEFKRKIRIAAGDFQNLNHFKHLLWPPFSPVAFCFLSHKVMRWIGPFFLIGALFSNAILAVHSPFYQVLFLLQITLSFLPFVDFILKKIGIHIVLLRFVTHFYSMNLSLLIGFFKSLKGIKSNVWKPTRRLQE
ncbi:MAG TPA: glycosyltransferase [Prolixibacteraceae bacterium]|nr:glycosyltransferase [Prolixibacteraceae bacterium]